MPTSAANPTEEGRELHSVDEAGTKSDAHLHEPMLDAGDHRRALHSWLSAGDHGMDDGTLLTLYGHHAVPHLDVKPVDHDPFAGEPGWRTFSAPAATHTAPDPSWERPRQVMDAAGAFAQGGLHGLAKQQGMATPEWPDALAHAINNPDANAALGMVSGLPAAASMGTKGVSLAAHQLPDAVLSALTLTHRVYGPEAARDRFFAMPLSAQRNLLQARGLSAEGREAQTRHLADSMAFGADNPDYARAMGQAHFDPARGIVGHVEGQPPWPSNLPEPGPVERGNSTGFNRVVPTTSEAHKHLLKEYLGLEPEQFKGTVTHYEDGGFHLEGEIRDHHLNEPIGYIEREVNPAERSAEHNGLSLRPQFRNNGIANDILRHNIDWYRANGIDTANVFASSADGGYHWARRGFVPEKEGFTGWDTIRKRVGNDFDSLHATLEFPESVHREAKAILADPDPRAIWRLADLNHPVASYLNGVARGPIPLGKRLLSGERWDGSFDVNDPDIMKRFDDYHAYVKAKGKKP